MNFWCGRRRPLDAAFWATELPSQCIYGDEADYFVAVYVLYQILYIQILFVVAVTIISQFYTL